MENPIDVQANVSLHPTIKAELVALGATPVQTEAGLRGWRYGPTQEPLRGFLQGLAEHYNWDYAYQEGAPGTIDTVELGVGMLDSVE